MRTIGIRAAPSAVTFAVIDTDDNSVVNVEKIKIPAAFETPDALKYVRSNLLDILREYEVERAGIRVTESSADGTSVERIQIEGVIQEAFASSDLKAYYVGQISSISARVGIDRARFKPMVAGEDDPGVENWDKMTKEAREAILCAIGAKNA
jgi:Holliday junction resolvasome RuvABC endonuclease subunit